LIDSRKVKMAVRSKKDRKGLEDELSFLKRKVKLMEMELRVYRELGGGAVDRESLGTLLNRFMDFAIKAVETDSGTLYLVDEHNKELSFEVVKGPISEILKGMRIGIDKGIAGHVVKTGRPYVSGDLERDKRWLGLKASFSQMNMMAVPLKVNKRIIGVIEVLNKAGEGPFTKEDLRVITSLANHFSVILERSELVEALDERLIHFSTLNEVGNLLISTLDEKVVRERAMEAITRLMNAEAGSLLQVDGERGELYFEVARGKKGRKVKEIRLRIGEGIAGWVAKYGRPLLIHDVTRDKRFQKSVDERSGFKTLNMVCVPVRIKGNIIGVLQAINKKSGEFSSNDLGLFQHFSNQFAIALDNARLYEEIRETFYATAEALADAIEKRDPYTGGHTKRVLEYSLAVGKELGLSPEMLEKLKLSAVLHDIGKIGIDDRILQKKSPLDDREFAAMTEHPSLGVEIVNHVPQLKDIIPGMLHHHERVDGSGYPKGYKGGKIPLIARIISVSDTYDAMTTTRPYRKGLTQDAAIKELKKNIGKQFDKAVVNAFLRAFRNGDIEPRQRRIRQL
jgi:HD-GYP domain-containing protein (c-di-GMP phosphodiesterase class II)